MKTDAMYLHKPRPPTPSVGNSCANSHFHANRSEATHIELTISNIGLGGSCKLEIADGSNDAIRITVVTREWESAVDIGREDVPKLIAALEMHMKARPPR